ncbi:MAG: peptidoglycan DD-metalloendopeptidase family protein [Candidatus Faecousia sp.]|nr:peptidoglycan DD-metalloendopeptidase family protein [Clostridiales bacterium]MDY6179967.1 peptidoglycan DD-metalloendopeptidase family protein [Candidatus Faecousia sp.]
MNNRKRLVSILAGIMAAVMLLTLIIGLLPTRASAASSSEIRKQINELKEQKKEIEEQIKQVQDDYKKNENEIADIVARKNVIDQEIGLLSAQIININEQISAFNILIADKQDELDGAQGRFDQLSEENKIRIRTMEEEGSLSYWEVLFKANDFSDLLDRLNMVEEIAASDKRRLEELDQAAQAVEEAQAQLELEKGELQLTKEELDAAQAQLDEKKAEADALLLELLAKADELKALELEYAEMENQLLDDIAAKEQEYNETKLAEWLAYMATYTTVPPETSAPAEGGSTNGSSGTNSGNSGTSPGGSSASSGWLVPCSYVKLTSPFGYRVSPTAGASTYHQGVDLAAPQGTPVYASRAGRVTVAGFTSAAGYYVTINHLDGYSSIYMHLNNYVVSSGQTVSAGQLIGYVGNSGIATGYHLHFGIAYNGAYVNPASYVSLY